MANEKPLYTLYKGLKANNYDVPENYESFERTLTSGGQGGSKHASESRHILYNALKAQNFDVPDSYESFYSTLFEPINATTSRAKGGYATGGQGAVRVQSSSPLAAGGHGAASVHVGQSGAPTRAAASSPALPKPLPSGFGRLSIPSSPMPYVDEARRERAKVQGEGALRSWRQRVKSAQDTKDLEPTQAEQRAIDSARAAKKEEQIQQHPYSGAVGMLYEAEQGDTQAQKALSDAVRPALQQRKDALDYAEATGGAMLRNPVEMGMTLDHEGNVVGAPMYAPTVARDEKGDMILGDDGKPLVGMTTEQAARNTYKSGMEDAVEAEKRRRAEEQAQKEALDLDKATEDMRRIEEEMKGASVGSEEYWMLRAARNAAEDRIKDIKAVRDDKDGTFIGGLWRGFRDNAFDISNWNWGLTDTYEAVAKERARVNELLGEGTRASQELARQSYGADMAAAQKERSVGNGYAWGQIGGQSAPFAVDFLIGNELGVIKGVQGAVTRTVGRIGTKVGQEAVKGLSRFGVDVGRRMTQFGKAVVKNTGIAIGDVASAGALSTTIQAPRTGADILSRYTGNATFDPETGKYHFEGGETIGTAIYKGLANSVVENYTEMLGAHLNLGPAANNLLSKVGLKRGSEMIARMTSTDAYKAVSNMMQKAGYNGYLGEVIEEEVGIPLHALTDGSNKMSDLVDPEQQKDIVGGMAFSMGITGGAMAGTHGAAKGAAAAMYYRDKHKLSTLDKVAGYRMTPETWAPIKEALDNAENKDLQAVFNREVMDNGGLSAQGKEAAWQYAQRLILMRGHNIGQQMGAAAAAKDGMAGDGGANQAYAQGYNAVDGAADEHGIKVAYEQARDGVAGMYGEQFADQLDEDPVSAIETLEDGSKGQALASEYLRAKVAYEGMIQRAQDDMEDHVQEVTQQVERRVNTTEQGGDGMIHRATLKAKHADGTEHQVYVVNGTVQMTADGKMVDKTRSSASVVVYDPDSGKLEMVSAESIFTVDEAVDPTEELQVAVDAARSQFAEMRADQIDGFVPKQNPQQNDEVTVKGDDGQAVRGVVTEVDPLSGMYMVQTDEAVNGKKMQPFAAGQLYEAIGEKMDETDSVSQKEAGYRHGMAVNGTEGQAEDIPTESETEPGDSEEEDATTDTTVEQEGEATEAGPGNIQTVTDGDREGNTENASAISRIPVAKDAAGNDVIDKKTGVPVYRWHEASVGDTADALAELNEGSLINARDTAQDMEVVTNDRLTKLRKRKAAGSDPISISRSRQQNRLDVEDAEKELAYWRSVKDEVNRRMTAATAQRLQAEEAAKSEEQKAAEAEAKRRAQEEYERREKEQIAAAIKADQEKRNKEYPPLVAARKAFADDPEAMEVLNDTDPRDLEETVSSLLKPHSILWNDYDGGGTTVRGLRSELGLQASDMRRYMNLIVSVPEGARGVEASQAEEPTEPRPIGKGVFGNVYDQFKGKAKEAIAFLIKHKEGEAIGALHHRDIGDISIVWGDAKAGLQKIASKHPEVLDNLQELISRMNVVQITDNRIKLESDTHYAVVSRDWFGEKRTPWLLTAYEKKESSAINNTMDTADTSKGRRNDTATPQDAASIGKDRENSDTKQGNEDIFSMAERIAKEDEQRRAIEKARKETDTKPTEAQKEAGNYKKGHVKVDGMDVTIENPKGSVRSGKDANGKAWSIDMNYDYGYIKGTKGVDGDHIDVYLSDTPSSGNVYVVDQIDQKTGEFDEHKVMYGFPSMEAAREAYASQYEHGWKIGPITEVSREEFKKWVDSSKRKTKPFAEYKGVKVFENGHRHGMAVNGTEGDERVIGVDRQGNPIDANGKLVTERVGSVAELTDDDFLHPTRSVELSAIPKNVADAIGSDGKPVVIKKNIFEKNHKGHADLTPYQSREILSAALYNPDLYGQNQKAKRPFNWVIINTKDVHGHNRIVLLEVNEKKEHVEIVHWHYIDARGLEKIERQAEREGGQLLILPSDNSKEAGALSSLTDNLSSAGKDTQSSDTKQGKLLEIDEENLLELKDFATKTDSSKRTTVDEANFDSEDLSVPLLVDGKPSRLSVATVVSDVITDDSGQIALYDYSDEIDDKTNNGWQKWGDLSEAYNEQADKADKAHVRGDTATLGFMSVDAAVKFHDWMSLAEKQQSADVLENDTEARQAATEAVVTALGRAGIDVVMATEEQAEAIFGSDRGDVKLSASDSERRRRREEQNRTIDEAMAFVTGKDVKLVRKERMARERERKELAKEIYEKVLQGDFSDVTLRQIDKYISDATPKNPFGRRISERLPQRMERGLHEGERINAIEALFTRICESSVPKNGRFSKAGRRAIERRKEEALKGWSIATGHWRSDLSALTDGQEPIASGTDSDVYLSKDGKHVIKLSKGKFDAKFPTDPDAVLLFNSVFPNSAYRIVGYAEQDGRFVKILEQPFVDFSGSVPLTVEERESYMSQLGFKAVNAESTVFSNGEIVVADLQKNNIIKGATGKIRVIDADVKLHTPDYGGNYTYLPVEEDLPRAEKQIVYHGSGAKFDAFDSSHMGEGEGAQAYGWGHYVTEVEGIGRMYAKKSPQATGLKRSELESNIRRAEERLPFAKGSVKSELERDIVNWKAELENLGDGNPILYAVDIPDDNGNNYLQWEKPLTEEQLSAIEAYLNDNYRKSRVDMFTGGIAKSTATNAKEVDDFTRRGDNVYHLLESILGDDKSVSEMLGLLGYSGISYPAQYQSGSREDGKRNYVIFNDSDLKIVDSVEFMQSPKGAVYGWTVGDKIYLTKAGMNPNTPIHEYTHLWAAAMRRRNAAGWESIKKLLKGTPVWDEVMNDENYADIRSDEDAVASEALSRMSGRENAVKMEAEAQKLIDEAKDVFAKAEAVTLLDRMRRALTAFWKWVGTELFDIREFGSINEVTDRVLYDLVSGTDLKAAGASFNVEKQITRDDVATDEEEDIIARAKADGSYLKAPNGEPSNLSERQWVQVRTKAFKDWFGDWEKAARIEKLRKSEPVEITGEEYKGKYELERESAKAWIKDNLRGEYVIADTGEKVFIGRKGVNKVTSHSMANDAHLKSLVAVPLMLSHSIFITEEKAEKVNAQYPFYRYYVVGLNIDGVDYTAKLTIGVDANGNKYYDHALTEIEKGKLLDQINGQAAVDGFISTGAKPNPSVTTGKDSKLVSILQTNSSKVLDENGEPLVVDDLFLHLDNRNPIDKCYNKIERAKALLEKCRQVEKETGYKFKDKRFIYTSSGSSFYDEYMSLPDDVMILFEAIYSGAKPKLSVCFRYGDIRKEQRSFNSRDDIFENGVSVVGHVKDLNTNRSNYYQAFFGNSPYNVVIGVENGYKGGDGEILLSPAYVISTADNIGSLIKSATVNNGDFSVGDADIRYRHGDGALTDGELSYENDPVGKMLGRSTRTARQRREFAERERKNMADAVAELSKQLHLDHVEVVTDVSRLEGKRAKAKGYFSKRTGKITIVIPNHASVEDAEKTLLHEAVGHYGLRQLFGKQFDTFLDNVFLHAEPEIRREIVALAAKRGWDFRTATEEYLAGLAEDTNFEKMPETFWMKIKRLFLDMLHGLGFEGWQGPELGDNELRYLLWRSYENLKEPGRYRSILGEAADVAKQYELKVGNYEEAGHRHGMAVNGTEGVNGAKAAEKENVVKPHPHSRKIDTEYKGFSQDEMDKFSEAHLGKRIEDEHIDKFLSTIKSDSSKEPEELPFNEENFSMLFGNGVMTPIGHVKMSDNQMKKMAELHRRHYLALADSTLREPDFILSKPSEAKTGTMTSRNSSYIFVKTFRNADGSYVTYYNSVSVKKDGMEVVISNYSPDEREIKRDIKGSTLAYIKKVTMPTDTGISAHGNQHTEPAGESSAAKLSNNFGSGVKESENVVKPRAWGKRDLLSKAEQVSNGIDADLLFRDSIEDDNNTARVAYNQMAGLAREQFREAWQDSMINVRQLQDAILEQRGEKLESWEDAYNEENRSHGRAQDLWEYFNDKRYKPLLKTVNAVAKAANVSVGDVVEYMMAKHGLERNVAFAERDAKAAWEAYVQKQEEAFAEYQATTKRGKKTLEDFMEKSYDDFFNAMRERDYSGLTALTGTDNVVDAEAEAQRIVEAMESRAGHRHAMAVNGTQEDVIDELWKKTNAATKWTLRKAFESGIISKANYEQVRDMFAYYIPLRGWEEDTAGDVYSYVGSGDKGTAFSPTVHKAKGRRSQADNPIAYIGSMGVSAVEQGRKNMVNQSFMRFVMNHPTNLVTVSEMWYRNHGTAEAPDWREDVPDIPEDATAEDVERIVREHEEAMQLLEQAGLATKQRGRLHLNVPIKKSEALEHHVEVLVNGKKYVLYINGNPRAAQALNKSRSKRASEHGPTEMLLGIAKNFENMKNPLGAVLAWAFRTIATGQRAMGAFFTSKNPAFMIGNAYRDLDMALATTVVNESPMYAFRFRKALIRIGGPIGMLRLMHWYDNEGADMDSNSLQQVNTMQRYFYEFVKGGGRTGFTSLREIDDYKRDLSKEFEHMNQSVLNPVQLLKRLAGVFEYCNKAVEDMTRYAAFIAARQSGKDVRESATDAKNITLNFNRKGSGEMGNVMMRETIIFTNPSIQALDRAASMARRNPVKFSIYTAVRVLAGMGTPYVTMLLWDMFGGDDDDDDWNAVEEYWKLPSWLRRNNFVFWIPGTRKFAMIPLAQELRVANGFGETLTSVMTGHSSENAALQLVSGLASLLPVDFEGNGNNPLITMAPTITQPLLQVGFNTDFTGRPIYKGREYNKYDPAFQKAYVGTPSWLVGISAGINEATGGNAHRQGWLEQTAAGRQLNNPAVQDHLLKGYFGGIYSFLSQLGGVAYTLGSGETPDVQSVPVANRLVTAPREREQSGKAALPEWYYTIQEENQAWKTERRGFRKDYLSGDSSAKAQWERLEGDSRQQVISRLIREVQSIRTALQYTPEEDEAQRRALEARLDEVLERLQAEHVK